MYVSAQHLGRAMDLIPSMLQLNDPKCADDRLKGKKGHKRPRPRYGSSEIAVFKAIAGMMADKNDSKRLTVTHSCFPSLRRLARDLQLSPSTVWRAVTTLVDDSYLRTERIPGRLLRGPTSTNKWEGRRYWPGAAWGDPSVWNTQRHHVASLPEPSMAPNAEDDAIIEELADGGGPQVSATSEEQEAARSSNDAEFTKVLEDLAKRFPGHPSVVHENARAILRPAIRLMLELTAEKSQSVISVLEQQSDEIRAATAKSQHLGGYLAKAFPGWLQQVQETEREIDQRYESCLDRELLAFDAPLFAFTSLAKLTDFQQWLRKKTGRHLLKVRDSLRGRKGRSGDYVFAPVHCCVAANYVLWQDRRS